MARRRFAVDCTPMVRDADGSYRPCAAYGFRRYTTSGDADTACRNAAYRLIGPCRMDGDGVFTDGEGTHYRITARPVAI